MEFEITLAGGAKVVANYGGFAIATDQPVRAGGENSAPSPFDLFLVSLGTCAGYFVSSFCQQRNISTEGIRLIQRLDFDRVSHLVKNVEIEIQLPEGFPEQYRPAVIRAADLCTVKRHLADPPAVTVTTRTVSAVK